MSAPEVTAAAAPAPATVEEVKPETTAAPEAPKVEEPSPVRSFFFPHL